MLYHASPYINLSMILPQRTLSDDVYIGDFVFATSDRKLAAMYLANKGVATLMEHRAKQPYIIIQDDINIYTKNDKGGAIYTVPAIHFMNTPQAGLEGTEFVSKEPVTPLDKRVYKTSINAMRKAGIQIYFVSPTIFERLLDRDKKEETLATLTPAFR